MPLLLGHKQLNIKRKEAYYMYNYYTIENLVCLTSRHLPVDFLSVFLCILLRFEVQTSRYAELIDFPKVIKFKEQDHW